MKVQLPSSWTTHLVVIILLFSIGCTCFPVGYLAQEMQGRTYRPPYSFYGGFLANLTLSTPVVREDLGVCSEVLLYDWSITPEVVLLLQVKNWQNDSMLIVHLSHELNTSGSIMLSLRDLPVSPYTLEVQRQNNDTVFLCSVIAYPFYPMAPPSPLLLYGFWASGFILISVGIWAAHRFIRRTKEFLLETEMFPK